MIKKIQSQDYIIEIGSHVNSSLNKILTEDFKDAKKVIIVDENTHDNCLESLITNYPSLKEAEVILLPPGEENKVMEICFQVWEALTEYKIGRRDLIINLGGGVITDLGGFIASIYKRGVQFINMPTSLLAMVDASSGGKTGIDLGPYKNQLGLFAFPIATIIDPSFLTTLNNNELVWGKAEMLKHGLIADKEHWNTLKSKDVHDINTEDIFESVQLKNSVVLSDPKEEAHRKILNFGHTIGHALEAYFLDKSPLPHGYAVALGMLVESKISMDKNLLSKEEYYEIEHFMLQQYNKIDGISSIANELLIYMQNDKKKEGQEFNFTLLEAIGKACINQSVESEEIVRALDVIDNLK